MTRITCDEELATLSFLNISHIIYGDVGGSKLEYVIKHNSCNCDIGVVLW